MAGHDPRQNWESETHEVHWNTVVHYMEYASGSGALDGLHEILGTLAAVISSQINYVALGILDYTDLSNSHTISTETTHGPNSSLEHEVAEGDPCCLPFLHPCLSRVLRYYQE